MIRIRQIKVDILKDNNDELKKKISKKINIKEEDILDIKINKKSIDARDKNNIYYVYEVDINTNKKVKLSNDVLKTPKEEYKYTITGKNKMKERPIIVGSGPSGLFLAYFLSIEGFNPIIIERGEKIEDRIKTVDNFFKENKLNVNSNIQFGEGGAGTFSDGKLNTLVKDKDYKMKKVFEIFKEFGAPKEIMYENKPHIGTDKLINVVKNMREKIISLGGEFRFNTCLTDIIINNNHITQIVVNDRETIPCDNLFLAIGHSAKDTYKMLNDKGINMKNKPFSIGIRIQHPQELINKSMYGKYYNVLPPSSYKLTYKANDNKGVYSFCMCPGGYVVNASSEENKLVINGMSNYKRDTLNANSALIVTVDENDYGSNLFDSLRFIENLEEKAYKVGEGKIPTQKYIDFKNNIKTTSIEKVKPIFKGDYTLSNINDILPKNICNDLIEAIEHFSKIIDNYNMDDALISAVESRTSSPVRIIRDENYQTNIKGIYPIGEGSGYSGGITTSAMDGIRCFEKIIEIYKS